MSSFKVLLINKQRKRVAKRTNNKLTTEALTFYASRLNTRGTQWYEWMFDLFLSVFINTKACSAKNLKLLLNSYTWLVLVEETSKKKRRKARQKLCFSFPSPTDVLMSHNLETCTHYYIYVHWIRSFNALTPRIIIYPVF